jgi:hypothetical protein
MLVIVVDNAPPKLRGNEIWATVERWARQDTTAVMVWSSTKTEQGLEARVHGRPRRTVCEIEGLLVATWVPYDECVADSK